MAGLSSDVFVALPGGLGTLEELCEVVTWPRLGLHAKPCVILNILGYYSPLLRMFDDAVEEQFLKPENRALVLAQDGLLTLLQALEQWRPTHVEKWLSRDTRSISTGLPTSARKAPYSFGSGKSTPRQGDGELNRLSSSGCRMREVAGPEI
jgi:hypothetical protein